MESGQNWRVVRMGGLWQWLMVVVGLSFMLGAFMLFANAVSIGTASIGPAPPRYDAFMIPLISCLCGLYCLNQAMRVRFKWNEDVIEDRSRYFVYRKFNWKDLTDVRPTSDGVGRSFVFGARGEVSLTQTSGSGTVPIGVVRDVEAHARMKLRENARTA